MTLKDVDAITEGHADDSWSKKPRCYGRGVELQVGGWLQLADFGDTDSLGIPHPHPFRQRTLSIGQCHSVLGDELRLRFGPGDGLGH